MWFIEICLNLKWERENVKVVSNVVKNDQKIPIVVFMQ